MRLRTELWVGALLRRAELAGAFAAVLYRGDLDGGAVLLKTFHQKTRLVKLFSETIQGAEGERVWIEPRPKADEITLNDFIEKQKRLDPDLWVIEIEDGQGRHFLTEKVEEF